MAANRAAAPTATAPNSPLDLAVSPLPVAGNVVTGASGLGAGFGGAGGFGQQSAEQAPLLQQQVPLAQS